MAAATVDEFSGGRFILGVGSSHKVQVEAEHGVAYGKPLTRVRETVEIIRALLRDGRVQYEGETVRIEGFDLWFTPLRRAIPIYASAVFPKMTALCGEIADGIILTRSTLATAPLVRATAGGGRPARRPRPERDRCHHPAADRRRGEPPGGARCVAAGARLLCRVLSPLQSPDGRKRLPGGGRRIAAAWKRGDRGAAERAVSDALIDATSIAGTPEQCRERIEAYRRSGIDVPILSPFARGPGAKAKFEAAIRACAPAPLG